MPRWLQTSPATPRGTIYRTSPAARRTCSCTQPLTSPPRLSAEAHDGTVYLTWTIPPDNGAPIGSYKIYKGTSPGGESWWLSTKSTAVDVPLDQWHNLLLAGVGRECA